MTSNQNIKRRLQALKRKAEQIPDPEIHYDFSNVPTDILKRIAYPDECAEGPYTQVELNEILQAYNVIKYQA